MSELRGWAALQRDPIWWILLGIGLVFMIVGGVLGYLDHRTGALVLLVLGLAFVILGLLTIWFIANGLSLLTDEWENLP